MTSADELMTLTSVMEMNHGVLRSRDHPGSRTALDRLRRSGSVVAVFPGVLVDARRLLERRTRLAAALAYAPGAVLWGDDAVAALAGELDATPFDPAAGVRLAHTHTRRDGRGLRWVRRAIAVRHRVRVDGLRCPSAAYVAVEAAARDDGELISRFLRLRLVDTTELEGAVAACKGTVGQRIRRQRVAASRDNPWSGGERHLHALLRRHGLTGWVANARLMAAGVACHPDVLFPEARAVLEFDGYDVHSSREAFETDRHRQNALVLADYAVLRFTWRQLTDDPDGVVRQIRQLLARRTAPDYSS